MRVEFLEVEGSEVLLSALRQLFGFAFEENGESGCIEVLSKQPPEPVFGFDRPVAL